MAVMIGFYDYTVILTYLSLVSSTTGIIVTLSGGGHPYIGAMLLLFCGLCDAFDGKVARMKKNRTKMECNYGIQIDSLSDLVAFGVLPACIGFALFRTSDFLKTLRDNNLLEVCRFVLMGILVLYVLAAMIRLAYFNVTEEERQSTEGGVRKTYTGLPVTSASIILPTVLLLSYAIPKDIAIVYFPVVLLMAILFVSKIQIKKPQMKHIMMMVAIGVAEAIAIAVYIYLYR